MINQALHDSASSFLEKISNDTIDLTVTSPPYDKLRAYNSSFDIKMIARELFRATKTGGVCVWVVSDQTRNFSESGSSFKQALEFISAGWCLFDTMIWKKANWMPGPQHRYSDCFEYMFVFSKGKPKTFNPIKVPCVTAGKTQKWSHRPHESKVYKANGNEFRATLDEKIDCNVWEIPVGGKNTSDDDFAKRHSAPFPEKLASKHISTWTNPGDLVCDFFLGSGTTAKVAQKMGRRWIGCDIEKASVELTNERLRALNSELQFNNQEP